METSKETKRPCQFVLIGNEKGGCGKTTTVLSLSACLTALGYKVLCVDFDPSGNLTRAALPREPQKVIYDVFEGTAKLQEAIVRTGFGDVLPTAKDDSYLNNSGDAFVPFAVPNSKSLTRIGEKLLTRPAPETYLRKMLRGFPGFKVPDYYDFVLIDVGPSDNVLVRNAIYAADQVVIPCEPESQALNGVQNLINTIRIIEQSYNKQIPIDGLLVVNWTKKKRSQQVSMNDIDYACEVLSLNKYRTIIRDSDNFPTSHRDNRPILEFMARGNAAPDSMNMTLEFLERRGMDPLCEYPGVHRTEIGNLAFERPKKENKKK